MIFSYAYLSVYQPCSCDMKKILTKLQINSINNDGCSNLGNDINLKGFLKRYSTDGQKQLNSKGTESYQEDPGNLIMVKIRIGRD